MVLYTNNWKILFQAVVAAVKRRSDCCSFAFAAWKSTQWITQQ